MLRKRNQLINWVDYAAKCLCFFQHYSVFLINDFNH